jgi:hypothetical protein
MPSIGGQPGNDNAKRGNQWREALRQAVTRYEDDEVKRGEALYRIAVRVVKGALEGDEFSIRELGDRLDGKAIQTVQGDDNAKPLFGSIQFVMIANPNQINGLASVQGETIENSPQQIEQAEVPPPLPRSVILGEGGTVE